MIAVPFVHLLDAHLTVWFCHVVCCACVCACVCHMLDLHYVASFVRLPVIIFWPPSFAQNVVLMRQMLGCGETKYDNTPFFCARSYQNLMSPPGCIFGPHYVPLAVIDRHFHGTFISVVMYKFHSISHCHGFASAKVKQTT